MVVGFLALAEEVQGEDVSHVEGRVHRSSSSLLTAGEAVARRAMQK